MTPMKFTHGNLSVRQGGRLTKSSNKQLAKVRKGGLLAWGETPVCVAADTAKR